MKKNDVIQNDDNWWGSVLSDEKNHASELGEILPIEKRGDAFSINWEKAQELYKEDAIIFLEVIGHNRGGLLVKGDDLNGFVPSSHLLRLRNSDDLAQREKTLAAYLGEKLKLKLIECTPEGEKIIFSERAAKTGVGRRHELFSTLTCGTITEGEVTNITDFGVFVDLGGVEGLIHISELSWGRVGHPSEIVQINEKIRVQVLNISPERCRVALSLKQLFENPWEKIQEKYELGQIVSAEITAIISFGAFAQLEKGIEGLIHSSEIPFDKRDIRKGAKVESRILQIDAEKQRISLSLKLERKNG